MSGYDTNLAAEFYVLSCLHKRGLTANLTLGNKKGVDVVVVREVGDAVTVEVKGVAKKYDWPANNLVTQKPDHHFVALVSFEGHIEEIEMPSPRVWIVPFPDVERFERFSRDEQTCRGLPCLQEGGPFENAWHLIEGVRADAAAPAASADRLPPPAEGRRTLRGRGDYMGRMATWRGTDVDFAISAGGVRALASPWDNVGPDGVSVPGRTPELIQEAPYLPGLGSAVTRGWLHSP